MKNKRTLAIVICAVALVAGAAVLWLALGGDKPADPSIQIPPSAAQAEVLPPPRELEERAYQNDVILPVGTLLVTKLRAEYEEDSMRLVIPKLDLDCQVGGDTLLPTLRTRPGLYKYAQIPNTYNTNVSIAAHRDLFGCEFYYLDTLGEGDFIYLVYQDFVFRYRYLSAEVVDDNNWDPIRCHYDSRVTLTTCDPIGTSLNRLIVVGELIAAERYSDEYVFA